MTAKYRSMPCNWSHALITTAVIISHISLLISPSVAAAREAEMAKAATTLPSHHDDYNQALAELGPVLQDLIIEHSGLSLSRLWPFGADATEALDPLMTTLQDVGIQSQNDFDRDAAHIQSAGLDDVIQQRHQRANNAYQDRHNRLMNTLQTLRNTSRASTIAQQAQLLLDELNNMSLGTSHQPLDYAALPFGVNQAQNTREPVQSSAALNALTASTVSPAKSNSNPNLQASIDVQITPEIEAQAASLDHNPVAIYNWVYSEVEYLPLHLSLQGSQRTLQTRRGNAFDIASLLIALLRASGIEARYRYGTVRLPEGQVRNWLGNLESPEAALNLLGQGGIPVQGLAQGGQIAYVQMEHVWVDAHVDFWPSRGAKNFTPDAWIPLDAAFKQYAYSDGLPIAQDVLFDAQAFVDELLESASIDEDNGTLRDLDTALIESTFDQYLEDVNDYVDNTDPQATVGDVIGRKTIITRSADTLAAGLPYPVVAQADPISALPDNLRGQFSFSLYASPQDKTYDNAAFTFTDSLPNLSNTQLTLSFEPASDEDRETIESYLPEPDENGEIDPEDLPDSLPGYLINLTAQFKRNGAVLHSAGPFPMGTELASKTAITRLTGGELSAINYPIAGEFHAIGLALPGGTGENLESIQARLQSTQEQLEAEQYEALTKEQLVGDLLSATINGYFSAAVAQMTLLNRMANGQLLMQPGYGNANTVLTPEYRYGSPRKVYFDGLGVDIDGAVVSGITSNNESAATLIQQYGTQLSALEHRILEILFTDETNPGEAASTVKALTKAVTQGQTLYTLDQSNIHYLDQITTTQAIKDDIRSGVNAGLIATIHEQPVNIGGWTGTGYSLVDPITGAGAYRIGIGQNGGNCSENCVDEGVAAAIGLTTLVVGETEKAIMLLRKLARVYNFADDVETLIRECDSKLLLQTVGALGGLVVVSALVKTELRNGKFMNKPIALLAVSLALAAFANQAFKALRVGCQI